MSLTSRSKTSYGKVRVEEPLRTQSCEVSAYILNLWRLPAEVTEAIRHHHSPRRARIRRRRPKRRESGSISPTRAAQLLLYPDQALVLKELREFGQTHYQWTKRN